FPYSKITKILFSEIQTELLDIFESYLQENWFNYISTVGDIDDDLKRKYLKIKEHIALSIVQRTHIDKRMTNKLKEFDENYKKVNESFNTFEEKLKDIQKEVKNKYDNIITQFIGILGIFSAILMGAFGSKQGFTSIYNNAHILPIGKISIVSSIGCSAVIFILFFLLNAISKMIGSNISSCDCYNEKKGSPGIFQSLKKSLRNAYVGSETVCTCSLFEKHPSLVIIHYALFFIAVSGFSLTIL